MPKIKVDHIVSFSSEDPVHVANNLLNPDPNKKWKCLNPGEKTATIILQLEKASVISGIDVGNEYSAYIEILVTRSGMSEDYKVLLVMSSFMKPIEARQGVNVNAVRMFKSDQLSKPECDQKWDRVKIVCTQPFNRHVQYGLSFINFHAPEDKALTNEAPASIGKFTLRPKSPENFKTGALFSRIKEQKENTTVAAAIREASNSSPSVLKPKLLDIPKKPGNPNGGSKEEVKKLRNRNELLYDKDEEEPHDKIDKIIAKKNEESNSNKLEEKKTPVKNIKNNEKTKTTTKTDDNKPSSSSKRKHSDTNKNVKKVKIEKIRKPFNQLLEGVVLVISGIQNPDRANLRSMALSMGAKYKPDWDNTCTHLICAFPNTPKFNQVRGKGKIVKRKWIEDCHQLRKRLPWRRYCLDKNDTKKDESEEEILELTDDAEVTVDVDADTDVDDFDNEQLEEASDTEERVKAIQTETNIYDADTDTEEIVASNKVVEPNFKDFFSEKTFYIDSCFEKDLIKKINKYIVAYNGNKEDDPLENIDLYVTSDSNVEDIRRINPNAVCIQPDWIWECHNKQKLIPVDDYLLQ